MGLRPHRVLPSTRRRRHALRRRYVILYESLAILLVILAIIVGGLFIRRRQQALPIGIATPFTAKTLASLPFTVYYPSWLPAGYHIDPLTITQPQAGVIVLTIVGPHSAKIYMSQEARVTTFNYGGYYSRFSHLHEQVASSGTIATGYINGGQTAIGSLATSETWLIVTAGGSTTPDQLAQILSHLAVSH